MPRLPFLPHELVETQILLRLPPKSLLRFRCVCKSWRNTIADDSFRRAHLRLQNVSLLIVPQIHDGHPLSSDLEVKSAGLYRWEESKPDDATLVDAMSDSFFPCNDVEHDLAHCDGLILVPADDVVRVINPATQRVLTLPWSPHISMPRDGLPLGFKGHQTFGLGHDPCSNTYKVARFFYNSLDRISEMVGYTYTLGMEVYTLGVADKEQRHWRETSTPPPYPAIIGRTATFFKGSLLWTIDETVLGNTTVTPGFIRFSLEDESFSVMPPPPCRHRIHYAVSSLAELRGELCVCVPQTDPDSLEIWMCHDLELWDRRHVIAGLWVNLHANLRSLRPVIPYGDAVVLHARSRLFRCDHETQQIGLKNYLSLDKLSYHHPDTDTLVEYRRKNGCTFIVLPYIPSLVHI